MPVQKYQRITDGNRPRAPLTPTDRHELFAAHHTQLSATIGKAVRAGASSDEIILTLSTSNMSSELFRFLLKAIRHEIEWWQVYGVQVQTQPLMFAAQAATA
jgi:hypothetical protein